MSTISDQARRELYQRAEGTWGKEAADTLMAYLPPVGYADVATKSDVELLRAEVAATEARMLARMDQHAAEVADRFTEVARQFTEVHEKIAEVHKTIAEVHKTIAEVHAAIAATHKAIAGQSRWFVIALSGTVIAVSALPQVVDRLLGG